MNALLLLIGSSEGIASMTRFGSTIIIVKCVAKRLDMVTTPLVAVALTRGRRECFALL